MALESKSKLRGMKMPGGPKDDWMSGLEEGSPEEESGESTEEEAKEGPNPDLEHVSDEDLLAEMKKRGLTADLGDHGDMGR